MSYDYDADGHVIAIHYPDGTFTAASYDDSGKLVTSTDITGAVTTYTYNPGGTCGPAPTDMCQAVQARDGKTLARVSYGYDPMDRVHTITRGNGVATTIDYTDASQVKTETTSATDGTALRTDGYTYDAHDNVATHTITSALSGPRQAQADLGDGQGKGRGRGEQASPATTTAYRYDAYNRLLSSAVYPGATATGTPTSTTTYTVDAAGNVTGQDTTTSTGTSHTVNTITPGGELTGRTVNGAATSQKFDADGNVSTDIAGDAYTYNPDAQQDSVTTPAGVTTRYAYWPDHTRRTATTTVGGVAHVVTYHYATTGGITNDTYTGGGPATITASYLTGVNREARTLTSATGNGPGASQDTGPGTGYYLTDAHGSVTAMIETSGAATASYAYGDYGLPEGASAAPLPAPAADPAGNAAVNPFTYDGAYTNPSTGTQYLPDRSYDPGQGRFLSADAADQFNRYQAFSANPIVNTDPTGQLSVPQAVSDGFTALLFIGFGILSLITGGAGVAALAAETAEVAATAVISAAANVVSGVTNIAAAATTITSLADEGRKAQTGKGFLSDQDEQNLSTATFFLGNIAGVTGVAAGASDLADGAAESAYSAGPLNDRPQQPAELPAEVEPVAVQPEPVNNEVEPVAVQPEPVNNEVEPVAVQPEPVINEVEAVAVQPEPVINEIELPPPATDADPVTGTNAGLPEVADPAAPQRLSSPTGLPDTTFGPVATTPETGLMPTDSSFTETSNVPGSPQTTDPTIVPTPIEQAGPTNTSPAITDPIGQNITTGVEAIGGSNTELGTPDIPG